MLVSRTRDILLRIGVFIIASALIAIALNNFLIPNNIFSAGFNGISQLISLFLKTVFGVNVQVGFIAFAFNVPVAIVGWFWAGKNFTILSFLNNFLAAFLQVMLPKTTLVSHDPILAALFGGDPDWGGDWNHLQTWFFDWWDGYRRDGRAKADRAVDWVH